MLKNVKQVRAAFSRLKPEELRERATHKVAIGLVAASDSGYTEMEDFLAPPELPREMRMQMLNTVHRVGSATAPDSVDVVLYHHRVPAPEGTYRFDARNPMATVEGVLREHDDLALSLARHFPAFRQTVVHRIIQAVARENAMFAIATALPNVVPNLIELPWAFGEFASDTVFLTANQVRMAFLIAAASAKEVGFTHQVAEIAPIVAAAFGWRALARELAGKIPMGGGLIPKGAIAYAGTIAVGKGLEYFHQTNIHFTREQRSNAYQSAFERGRAVAEALIPKRT